MIKDSNLLNSFHLLLSIIRGIIIMNFGGNIMDENLVNNALVFIKKCDDDFSQNLFLQENAEIAKKYLTLLRKLQKSYNSNLISATIKKLDFIIKQIDAVNYHTYRKESILNLVSLSVTDYIISLIMEKHLTDPLLIARYAYIELSKVLYYDISYFRQDDLAKKRLICDTPVDLKKEKIFSYVVCTQWLALYTYILKAFDINVIKRSIPGQDHVWGEIVLKDGRIVIVDATDYITSSIDLSNAKSISPTVGFAVLPKEYSGIKLYDVFNNRNYLEIANIVKKYYELNRDLDITLGYISKKGYPAEIIIRENEIFNYPESVVTNPTDLNNFVNFTLDFFRNLKIPNNIDGYELYAYYYTFIKRLPKNIAANISQQTVYVDSFSYKQNKMSKKFLHAPSEYLKYLESLVYSRYYKYLTEEENNEFLKQMKEGHVNGEQVRDLIAKYEIMIAEINRNINLYYAINKLHFYDPNTCDTIGIQLYEPMMGTKILNSIEEYNEFKKVLLIK